MRKNKIFTAINWLGDCKITSFFMDDNKYVCGFFTKTLNRPGPRYYTKSQRLAYSNEIFLIRKIMEDRR